MWLPGAMKETSHLLLPLLKAEKAEITGLACGHRKATSQGV